jgi:hypothetical protein
MSQPLTDKESVLVDVSGVRIDDLLRSEASPLLESLRRLAAETDADPIAGFAQGLS